MEAHESFFTRLDGRIAAIEEAWLHLKAGWDGERLQALYQRVCEISESSQRLSLFQLNEAAFSLEVYLSSFVDTPAPPSGEQLTEIEGLVRGLQAVATEAAAVTAATEPDDHVACTRNIYALVDESSPAAAVAAAVGERGCQVTRFTDVDQLVGSLAMEVPALIVTDTAFLDRLSPLSDARRQLADRDALQVPLVFVSDQSQLSVRVSAMRAGATAYFVTPLHPAAIAGQLAAMSEAGKEVPYRITVVEDDPAQADFAATILRRAGMEVSLVTDPLQVVDALQAFQPDLILMDIYMPDVDGLELTRIIRDFNDFVTTPIVFLSGERDTGKQMDALSVGGDDFIAKPIEPRRLISVVQHRIRRSRRLCDALAGGRRLRDPVTGLLSRNVFLSHAAAVIDQPTPGPRSNALLYLQPDDLDGLLERLGIGALDALIAAAGDRLKPLLAAQDLACRWRDHSLLVLLRRDTGDLLAEAAETLQQGVGVPPEDPTFCAGLRLLQHADEDLDMAIAKTIAACRSPLAAPDDEAASTATTDTGGSREPARPPTPIPSASQNLTELIRTALSDDSFGVYYQPLLNLQTQGSENYEILLALPGPQGETLTWRKLSEPAKRAGLQTQLDRWVLARALDILIERISSGRHTQIFVRQSLATAADPEHPRWLAEQLQARGAHGTGLVLDYALTDLSQDVKNARANQAAMEELGVQLAISRFVAKPAAYKVLRYLDADYVRVARKLLKADRETISDLIAEAHRLNARVIVSHVDDPRAIDLHWSSGADYLQGNFIQRPLEDMDYDFSQVVI